MSRNNNIVTITQKKSNSSVVHYFFARNNRRLFAVGSLINISRNHLLKKRFVGRNTFTYNLVNFEETREKQTSFPADFGFNERRRSLTTDIEDLMMP